MESQNSDRNWGGEVIMSVLYKLYGMRGGCNSLTP